jgi:two-component system phosphate regulon response regulator OmpR
MNALPPKPHILVVDDDESMRFMLQTKLFQCGYNVTLAASGTHAIQILQTTKKFDLVICDLKMPLKGGIDVIRFMKDNGIETPTVILTGFPERDKIISAAQMGIQDVLVKPVRHNDLMNMVRTKLGENDEAQDTAA